MSIDVQRYRDASMSWLRVSDMLLLTPGRKRARAEVCGHAAGGGD